jgi:hypothetical protein
MQQGRWGPRASRGHGLAHGINEWLPQQGQLERALDGPEGGVKELAVRFSVCPAGGHLLVGCE